MLGCDDVSRELSELVDGELSFFRRMQIYAHLAMCRVCLKLYKSLKETVHLLGELRDHPPQPERGHDR
ncbi:MAG: zf-HC2 domain-containing protein [Proteobacteria bacterium]|nr:zf-HC2 domain-containing protein [Pseudomonadota bacterium]